MAEGYEIKKLDIIRILQVLERHSDVNHKLTQDQIIHYLDIEYGLMVDRKTVGRNIQILKDLFEKDGMSDSTTSIIISSDRKGTYIEKRLFEESELRLIIDSILASKYIPSKDTTDLIKKLKTLANEHYVSHIKHVYSVNDWERCENREFFSTIDIINQAIEEGKKIEYDYNKYGADKKLHKTSTHIDSPYQLVLRNQRYYLMSGSDKYNDVGFLRVDKITNIRITNEPIVPLKSYKGYEYGMDYKKLATGLPYMFAGDFETITFNADMCVADDVIDYFGKAARIRTIDNNRIQVIITASVRAMEYWALQYIKHIEIISPRKLRDMLKEDVKNAYEKYNME